MDNKETNEEWAEKLKQSFEDWLVPFQPSELACEVLFEEIKSLILSQKSQWKKSLIEEVEKVDTKEHICRFNDGEQNCECYIEAKNDCITLINNQE